MCVCVCVCVCVFVCVFVCVCVFVDGEPAHAVTLFCVCVCLYYFVLARGFHFNAHMANFADICAYVILTYLLYFVRLFPLEATYWCGEST